MKTIILIVSIIFLSSFKPVLQEVKETTSNIEISIASISIINDTKEKISIHTGSGFVSLNKGSKTSITCNTSKEVRWANKGKKGDVIFKITSDMCGKTLKISKFL
jgi:hypothetical protein